MPRPTLDADALALDLEKAEASLAEVLKENRRRRFDLGRYEIDVSRLLADREALLERLKLTEHQWWCLGGRRFGDFYFLTSWHDGGKYAFIPPDEEDEDEEGDEDDGGGDGEVTPLDVLEAVPSEDAPQIPASLARTIVVNMRDCPADWKSDPSYVYVGRRSASDPGEYGNRHPIGFCMACDAVHDRWHAVHLHAIEAKARYAADPTYRASIEFLRGKKCVCFCKEDGREVPCHADVYLELLDAAQDAGDAPQPPEHDGVPPLPDFEIPDVPGIPPLPDFGIPPLPVEVSLIEAVEPVSPLVQALALFAPKNPSPKLVWTYDQGLALEQVEEWLEGDEPLFSLTGPAGSGKTSLAREIVARHPGMTLTAMTGKAAVRLSQLVDQSASTLHSKLYYPPLPGASFTRMREPPSNKVITDEASMAGPYVVRDLRQWGCRVLLVGDGYQLPAVITGQELKEFGEDYSCFAEIPGASLETVMRSVGGVLRAATRLRETGEIQQKSDLDGPESGYEFLRHKSPMEHAVDAYLDGSAGIGTLDCDTLLITWRNMIRMQANRIIRTRLGHDGPLPDDGEPVLLKRNGQGYLNGEIVRCHGFEEGPTLGGMKALWMHVGGEERILVTAEGGRKDKGGEWMDGQQPWVSDFKKYHIVLESMKLNEPIPITWAYCLSGHSAQGSQAKRTIVFLGKGDERSQHFRKATRLPDGSQAPFSARWGYTATTRSTTFTKMVMGR